MKRLLSTVMAMALLLTGCAAKEGTSSPAPESPQDTVTNFESIRAVWIPMVQYETWMTDKTEADFQATVQTAFANCKEFGINTVFVHVRAFGDAYYDSRLYPRGSYQTGDYDALGIMVKEAHAKGLSIHAWINPMRCQLVEDMPSIDTAYTVRQWTDDPEKNGTFVVDVDGRYWLDPAYEEVRGLVTSGVKEILEGYDVDGIHIDDYFYPTQEEFFDEQAFRESGEKSLEDFRRENCTKMVKSLYDTVKAYDENCIFSISPQGNIDNDYNKLYADVYTWAGEPGYCDWMIPQIYFGFQNDTCPFEETLQTWQSFTDEAALIPGLAVYKIGNEDKFAGSGSQEWIENDDVISSETQIILDSDSCAGVVFYNYASLFTPEDAVKELVDAERERVAAIIAQHSADKS